MKFPRHILASLGVVALLSGCGKTTTEPTAPIESPTLDTTAPDAPSGLNVMTDANGMSKLTWNASTAADVAKYQIFQYSPDPTRDNSYVLVWENSSSSTAYTLDPTASVTTAFFKVLSVDGAGNKSSFSSALSVELSPPSRSDSGNDNTPPNGHIAP